MSILIDENNIRVERLILGPYETNCYIIICKKTFDSLVIDAPADAASIINALRETIPKYILLTHGHDDHTGALTALRARLKAPLAAHTDDSASLKTSPEIDTKDGDIITLGNLQVRALHAPGHTPGSLCFKTGKYLFAGDTIFPGGPGHTESPADFGQILKSITVKILTLPDDTIIFPGHGESTTVEKSKQEYAAFAARKHPDDLYGDILW
jgi:hydroxyacylglutathione hydrolase